MLTGRMGTGVVVSGAVVVVVLRIVVVVVLGPVVVLGGLVRDGLGAGVNRMELRAVGGFSVNVMATQMPRKATRPRMKKMSRHW
jgi:hypothetical protein